MSVRIAELSGVTTELAAACVAAAIKTSDQLLAAAADPKARAELAAKLGIDEKLMLKLANRADLARVVGIGRVYSDLLEFAGVDTVVELAQRNADNLFDKIMEVAGAHTVQRPPRREAVKDWVEQAKQLERRLHY